MQSYVFLAPPPEIEANRPFCKQLTTGEAGHNGLALCSQGEDIKKNLPVSRVMFASTVGSCLCVNLHKISENPRRLRCAASRPQLFPPLLGPPGTSQLFLQCGRKVAIARAVRVHEKTVVIANSRESHCDTQFFKNCTKSSTTGGNAVHAVRRTQFWSPSAHQDEFFFCAHAFSAPLLSSVSHLPPPSCAFFFHVCFWEDLFCSLFHVFSEMKTSVTGEINHMPSWSDASDCTTAVLEDLCGWVFYFLCVRCLRFFFRFTLLSRFCLSRMGLPDCSHQPS